MDYKLLPASLLLLSPLTFANDDTIERIQIHGHTQLSQGLAIQTNQYFMPDPGELLKQLPGANINRNGPLTPIAQYRGLYGDRVNVQINGVNSVGAGPNAMDTPLSYVPMALLESIEMTRGIAPVHQGINTLAGAYQVHLIEPEFTSSKAIEWQGNAQLGYQDNGEVLSGLGRLELANRDHALQLALEQQKAEANYQSGNGETIEPTHYDKFVGQLGYHQALDQGKWSLSWQHFDTGFSGTPALPMDINYVKTDRLAFATEYDYQGWQLKGRLNWGDADHLMDNFSQRANGEQQSKYRENLAVADDLSWHLSGVKSWLGYQLELGADGLSASHDSTITDPTNDNFKILNFNDVTEQHTSLYGYWRQSKGQSPYQLSGGLRIKHSQTDAGEVSHHMSGSSTAIATLVNNFNQAERKQSDWLLDLNLQLDWHLSPELQLTLAAAHKQKAPDYQQRYLWFPLEATAGLADGNTYTGSVTLKPETALQFNYGLRWQRESFYIEPHLFYQRIEDYIQGVATSNTTAAMVGEMMSGKTPLQFANVEAELMGMDLVGHWQMSPNWDLNVNASYVRGMRRDVSDNLYRIAPPSARTQLRYQEGAWQAQLNWTLVTSQKDVSSINSEQETAGYGLLGISGSYQQDRWQLIGGIDNLLDKQYQDHLGGYNRVMMTDSEVGERLAGMGRNLYLKAVFNL